MKKHFSLLMKLSTADYISLSAILPTIFGYYFILEGKPNLAIIVISFALFLDILDGYVARKLKITSEFGKQLDSFVDTLNYLVFSALFVFCFLNFNTTLTVVSVFIMLSAGILRLSRFNLEGFVENKNERYYTGIIVPFAQLSVITIFLASSFISQKIISITPIVLIVVSLLMTSTIKFKKPKSYTSWFFLVLIIIFLAWENLKK